MPKAANSTRSLLRNLGVFALHVLAWSVWLTLSVVVLAFIFASIGSPFERSAAVVGTVATVAVLLLSGALGAVLTHRLPEVRTAPFGPSAIALLAGLGGAQLRFASPTTEAALGGIGTLVLVWFVITGAVLLGEFVALWLLHRHVRAAD